jgi:hypothetical protein
MEGQAAKQIQSRRRRRAAPFLICGDKKAPSRSAVADTGSRALPPAFLIQFFLFRKGERFRETFVHPTAEGGHM